MTHALATPVRFAVFSLLVVAAPILAQPVVTTSSLERVQARYRVRGDAKPRVDVAFEFTPSTWKERFDEVLAEDGARSYQFGGGGYTNLDANVPLRIGGIDVPAGLHRVGLRRSAEGQWFLTLLGAARARELGSFPAEEIDPPVDFVIPLQVSPLPEELEPDPVLRVAFVPDSRQLGRAHLQIRWFRRQAEVEVFAETSTELPRGYVDIPRRPWQGEETTDSGLVWTRIEEGRVGGARPGSEDRLSVRYTMWRAADGGLADRTQEGRRTIDMHRLVPGMREALAMMEEGSIYHFHIPSRLAYADRGAGPNIPPDADLVLRMELVEIE